MDDSQQHHPWIPPRPATPQTLIHRLPDKPDADALDPSSSLSSRRPAKYIILLMASTAVAGKVQIATTVAQTLACPLYQGDSLHESSAKAASLGASSSSTNTSSSSGSGGLNEQRYRRMWLSKMTRTGLLFPEESRPANEGFSGFGGASSSSGVSSRRGSSASESAQSNASSSGAWSGSTVATHYTNRPPPPAFEAEPDAAARERRANPALLVLTHPELEAWHRAAIRDSVGEYRVGVVFVPLYHSDDPFLHHTDDADDSSEQEEEEEELPVLKSLDPRTMTSFASFDQIAAQAAASKKSVRGPSLDEEIVLRVNVEGQIEELIREIVAGVRGIMEVP
ncbi:hypothetical protein PG984_002651 [Apiospora sp. TS-2023a]